MTEQDVFESRLRVALTRHVANIQMDLDEFEFARAVATAEPRGRGRPGALTAALHGRLGGRRWSVLAPPAGWSPVLRMVWIAAVAGMLLAATVSAVYVGSQLLRRTSETLVVPPPAVTSTPTASPAASVSAAPTEDARALEPIGEPIVAETALGTITWQIYAGYAPDLGSAHGPVALDGSDLLWLGPDGAVARAALPEDVWGLAPLGDGLIAYGSAQSYGNGQAWQVLWDGDQWVVGDALDVPRFLFGSESTDVQVAAGSRAVLIVGYDVALAPDGQHFITVAQPPGGSDLTARNIGPLLAIADGFIALVSPGQAQLSSDPLFEPVPWFSADGVAWQPTGSPSPFGSGSWIRDVAGRDGRFVAVGNTGSMNGPWAAWVSDDGRTWERLLDLDLGHDQACTGEQLCPIGVTASDAGWVISTGRPQLLWASVDGRTWEPFSVPEISIDEPWGFLPPLALGGSTIVVVGSLNPEPVVSAIGILER